MGIQVGNVEIGIKQYPFVGLLTYIALVTAVLIVLVFMDPPTYVWAFILFAIGYFTFSVDTK